MNAWKISNLKIKSEFWDFADNWYQRAHKLKKIWQDPEESTSRKIKAFRLWLRMFVRVLLLFRIAMVIQSGKFDSIKFEKGGYVN